ncbi:MAG: hypothetical protein KatS3mg115_1390 [Candidatus Poribacteria bacterium]|nr:MAG: hypothetical protein KatS3mg115_1390 [Candidatus Poribacteria bacterium]
MAAEERNTLEQLFYRLETLVQKDHELLTQLDRKVSALLARSDVEEERLNDHERRIRELEFAKWKLAGVVAFLSALMPLLVSLLTRRAME